MLSKMEVLILINEDMRTVPRELCIHRNLIRQELNDKESAALIDAILKTYKYHTEDDNCCYAVIHKLDRFGCNIACERPRSELPDVVNDRRICCENAMDH